MQFSNSLCQTCQNHREITSGRGSRFVLCELAQRDKRFAKYPPQPVLVCSGFQTRADLPPEMPAAD